MSLRKRVLKVLWYPSDVALSWLGKARTWRALKVGRKVRLEMQARDVVFRAWIKANGREGQAW